MRQKPDFKPIVWLGSSLKDLKEFRAEVQDEVGRALQQAQYGVNPASAKILSGFHGASVLEIKADYDGDAFRTVYTVRFSENIYVLHVFQKKSRHGIETSKYDIDLIKTRLKIAEELDRRQHEKTSQER